VLRLVQQQVISSLGPLVDNLDQLARLETLVPLVQVGLFCPSALRSTPFDQLDLTAEIRSDQATFLSHDDGQVHAFPRQEFQVDGVLPQAAV